MNLNVIFTIILLTGNSLLYGWGNLYNSICAPSLNDLHQSLTNDPRGCQTSPFSRSTPLISQFENWFTCIQQQNLNTLPEISKLNFKDLQYYLYNNDKKTKEIQALYRYFIRDCEDINKGKAIINNTRFTCQKFSRYDNSWNDFWGMANTCTRKQQLQRR